MSWQLAFNTMVAPASQVAVGADWSSPVSTTEQVEVLPLPSSAVTTIVCVMPSPEARAVPKAGLCVKATDRSQLSVAVVPSVTFVTTSSQLAFNTTGALASQVAVGADWSSPVNTTVQAEVLPLPSFAVTVIVCWLPSPDGTSEPASGLCVSVMEPEPVQLSVAVVPSTTFVTTSWQLAFNTMVAPASQVAVGADWSSPVSTTEQVEVLPLPSSAVTTIVCVMPSPEARAVPIAGDCDSVGTVQLSVAVVPSTTFVTMSSQLPFSTTEAPASQVAVGADWSSPVNTTVQVEELP